MRKRKTLLVVVCFMIFITLTGCLDKMPRVTVKTSNLDLTEEDFKELKKETQLLDGDVKEDFVLFSLDVYIENVKRNDSNKVEVLNLVNFNEEDKVRLVYSKSGENDIEKSNHFFYGRYYLNLRGLSREEVVNLYKELEIRINYVVYGNLLEEVYKFDDDFNLNLQ